MSRIAPSILPRLEFFVTDSAGTAAPSLTHADVTSAAYVLITAGVRAAGVAVALTGSVASTAAKVAGQFVTIDSARGHYAVDCPAGASLSTADSVELSVVMVDGTQEVWPVSHDIDVAVNKVYSAEVIYTGTTTTASTAGLFKVNTTGFPANSIRDALIVFTSGALAGQARIISAFTIVSGSEDQIAVSEAFSAAPSPGDSFTIRATHEHTILAIQTGLATPADVNAQVLDVLSVDTFTELSAPPASSSSLKDKLTWMFMWMRNKSTESTTQRKLYADDGTTVVSTETMSEAAGTFTKGEQS